jgi:hypothetical protein
MNSGGRSARPSGSLGRSVPRTPVRPQCMHGVQGGAGKARGGAPPHARRGPAHRRASPSCRSCCVRPKRAYSITLSARATNIAGTVTPIALAVLRLTRPTRGSQTAHQGRGAADGGELRQAAEAVKGQANAILFRNAMLAVRPKRIGSPIKPTKGIVVVAPFNMESSRVLVTKIASGLRLTTCETMSSKRSDCPSPEYRLI